MKITLWKNNYLNLVIVCIYFWCKFFLMLFFGFFIESSEVKYKKHFGKHSTEYQERASPGKTKAIFV